MLSIEVSKKGNMKGIVILSLMLILGEGKASPQRSTSSPEARLGAIPFPGEGGNRERPKYTKSDNSFELKCDSDRGICKGHCNSLGYVAGGCIDDVCYCHSGDRATFECDRIAPAGEIPASEEHNICKIRCQLLRKEFVDGECVGGKCRCKEQSHERKNKTSVAPTSFWQQTYGL